MCGFEVKPFKKIQWAVNGSIVVPLKFLSHRDINGTSKASRRYSIGIPAMQILYQPDDDNILTMSAAALENRGRR
jgi:hypothetical protein